MTGIKLLNRIGDVDPDLIREAERALARKGGKVLRRRIVAAITAACLILLAGVGTAIGFLSRTDVPIPSGCLIVGSPINLRSPDYYSRINEHSIVKELDSWTGEDSDGDPTIRITGSGTMRFGIEFVVTFDSAIAPDIPEEERALIAAFIGWTQSADFRRKYECYQPEFIEREIFGKIERMGLSYEELLQNAATIYEAILPFDNALANFRVMDYRADANDRVLQQNLASLERDLIDAGLDPAKIEQCFLFTLADEPVATYDGVFRTDPTDPEIPDASDILIYRFDGVWYYDPCTFSDELVDMANPNYTDYYYETDEGEGDVVWINGSYCRVTTDEGDLLLHANDPSQFSGIAAGDSIGFSFYANCVVNDALLLIGERDSVPVANAVSVERR